MFLLGIIRNAVISSPDSKGETVDYIIQDGEHRKGPYTLTQIKAMWERGLITSTALYWSEGPGSWSPLHSLIEGRQEETSYRTSSKNSSGINQNPFTTTGRWGRARFLGFVALYTVVYVILGAIINPGSSYDAYGNLDLHKGPVVLDLYLLLFMIWVYCMVCAAVKRMHDLNWSAWGVIVLIIPFTWLFLVLAGGTEVPNRYGLPASKQS